MTLAEIVDYINADLTMSCSLPQILPTIEIQRLVMKNALPWFYENYYPSLINSFLYIPNSTLSTDHFLQFKYITLPENIQTIRRVFQLSRSSVFEMGFGGAPNLSIGVGVTTNQQYLSSSLTAIGELGVYKVIIDGFANELNKLSKTTMKYDYNFASKQFNLLTRVMGDIVVEVMQRLDEEDVFEMDKFRRYALALSKKQMGQLVSRYDYTLPGGIKINGAALVTEGNEELTAVRDEITKQSQTGFFFLTN